MSQPDLPATPHDVLRFWQDAGPQRWFKRDATFDAQFHERFLASHEAAAAGALDHWLGSAGRARAHVLVVDQFTPPSIRGTPRL